MQELLDQVFNAPDVVVSSSSTPPVPPQLEPPPLVPEKPPELTPEAKEIETIVSKAPRSKENVR